jgi:hypothetical protein
MRSAIPLVLLLAVSAPVAAQVAAPAIPPSALPTRDSLRGVLEPARDPACVFRDSLFDVRSKTLTDQQESRSIVVYGPTANERRQLEAAAFAEDRETATRACGIVVLAYDLPTDMTASKAAEWLARLLPELRWSFVRD